MMKLVSNIVLIVLVLHSQLYNSLVTINYEINIDYYAQELCENKDKPQLRCDGKCYFAKQLELEQDRQKETEPPTLLPSLRLFPAPQISPMALLQAEILPDHYHIHNLELPENSFRDEIDHPPQV